MKNIYSIIASFISVVLFIPMIGNAQSPLSLYYLENVPQTVSVNPAMVPRANAFFGIPGINSVYTGLDTDILGPDIFQKYNGGYVTLTQDGYDYDKFYNRIGKAANIAVYQTIAPLVMGFSGKKGYFTFSVTEKASASLAIPKDYFSILDKGIVAGNKLDFTAMAADAQYYREFSFGYSYKFMSNLRVGIHAKFLQGLVAMKTDFKDFSLDVGYTDAEQRHPYYDLNVKGDIYMAAPVDVYTNENGFPDSVSMPEVDGEFLIDKGLTNLSNPGFAVDFGAVYQYNDAWEFSGSVNDLGFINWNGDLNSFTADGTFRFEGVDIDNSNIDSLDNVMDDLIDSVKQVVNLTHGSKGFSTGLGPKVYLGARYKVNHYFSVGALSRTSFYKNNFKQEFNVSANLNLYHVLTATVNYTLAINGANTVGFGLALRGGPLQFYFVADYLPYKYHKVIINTTNEDGSIDSQELSIAPTQIDNFNFMWGVNLLFGAKGFRDEPMINAYKEF